MQVFAYFKSAITGSEVCYELVGADALGQSYGFKSLHTGNSEMGTITTNQDKFESLDKFRKIYGNLSPRFELR